MIAHCYIGSIKTKTVTCVSLLSRTWFVEKSVEYDLLSGTYSFIVRIPKLELSKHAFDRQYIRLYSLSISISEQIYFATYDSSKRAQNDISSKSWKLTHFNGQLLSNKTRTQTLQAWPWETISWFTFQVNSSYRTILACELWLFEDDAK